MSRTRELELPSFIGKQQSLCRVYKAAMVARVVGLRYLRARVTLAGGLTFFLVNTPGRVTRLPGLTF